MYCGLSGGTKRQTLPRNQSEMKILNISLPRVETEPQAVALTVPVPYVSLRHDSLNYAYYTTSLRLERNKIVMKHYILHFLRNFNQKSNC